MLLYICQAPRHFQFKIKLKLNNWNSEKVCLVVCGCLVVVCVRLLVVCGRLLVVSDRLCLFVVVCGRFLF